MSNWTHVYPMNDRKKHDLTTTPTTFSDIFKIEKAPNDPENKVFRWLTGCSCEPYVDFKSELVIHNSFDCREAVEEAERILKGTKV